MDSSFLPHMHFRKLWIPTVFQRLESPPSLRIPIQISRPLRLTLLRVLLAKPQLSEAQFLGPLCSVRLPDGEARINQIFVVRLMILRQNRGSGEVCG